jgi:periplasmic protein TonB
MIAALAFPLLAAATGAPAAPAPPAAARPHRPPPANLADYLSSDDYPAGAADRREQGTVGFVVVVGENGRVEQCDIIQSSGSAALDAGTCTIARRRLRFNRARVLHQPVAGRSGEFRVTWRIDGE